MGARHFLRRFLQVKRSPLDEQIVRMDTKALAYELAHQRALVLRARPASGPTTVGLTSKPTTQRDVESPWFSYWCRQLKEQEGFHRKLWEYAFLLQTLHESGKLEAGAAGLGFACGSEPLPSYFASRGIQVVATDLDPSAIEATAWKETGQHATAIEHVFKPELVDRAAFDRLVRHEWADMNAIPAKYEGAFDFTWSICAMEHVGSIELGLRFVEQSMRVLKPGGIAIHTTELNLGSETDTVTEGSFVVFLKRHFLELAQRLERAGYRMSPPDFEAGNGVFDRYVDFEPYALHPEMWGSRSDHAHLKLALNGYPCTCFGIIVRKPA